MRLTKEEFRRKVLNGLRKRKKHKWELETEWDRYSSKRNSKYFIRRTKEKK